MFRPGLSRTFFPFFVRSQTPPPSRLDSNSPTGNSTSQVPVPTVGCGWAWNVAVLILGSPSARGLSVGWGGGGGGAQKETRETHLRGGLGPQALAVHMVSRLSTQRRDDGTAGPSRGCRNGHLIHTQGQEKGDRATAGILTQSLQRQAASGPEEPAQLTVGWGGVREAAVPKVPGS